MLARYNPIPRDDPTNQVFIGATSIIINEVQLELNELVRFDPTNIQWSTSSQDKDSAKLGERLRKLVT